MNRTKRTARTVTTLVVFVGLLWALVGTFWTLLLVGTVTVGLVLVSGESDTQRAQSAWVAAGSKATR